VINEKTSFEESKFVSFGAGVGFLDFSRESGIDGDAGFGFRLSGGHHFNRYLEAEFSYLFSTFRFDSPDPVSPAVSLNTRAGMNQYMMRMILTYPDVLLQPYISAGVGGYDWFGINSETALSFPIHFMFPVSSGVRAYVYRNRISLDLDFTYSFLLGENQTQDTLTLLGLNKVEFDTYSFMGSFTFHFL
jgi:hypothetical protein